MNKIYDGRPQWNSGWLNDATRNKNLHPGSAPSDYTFEVEF
jgi:hypothetical protein